ncbi:hypothetical protein UPYG_G00200940 [Umbra pygmaea]|uniref:Uncharacterized protein n=1 Tax=Umbra pygmaea TaxID=75934 RepID=A0ABD0WI75_UMBPY
MYLRLAGGANVHNTLIPYRLLEKKTEEQKFAVEAGGKELTTYTAAVSITGLTFQEVETELRKITGDVIKIQEHLRSYELSTADTSLSIHLHSNRTEFSTMAAASPQPMILRVVEPDQARKLKLSSRPASVDALINIIKEQLEIDLDFNLLYEDPDFDGKLTSLADIEELPQKAVVHISLSQDSSSSSSVCLLSDVSSPERLSRWPPGSFPVPTFGV